MASVAEGVGKVSGAISDSRDQFDLQSEAMGGNVRAQTGLQRAYGATAAAVENLTTELGELDDFLNKRGTFRAYQASLDALKHSLKDAPHAFSAMNEAGRTNLGNLDQILAETARHLETITSRSRKLASSAT